MGKVQITPQSKEGQAIRDAYDRLIDIQRELHGISETLDNPFAASQHIIKAQNYASQQQGNLIATGVIQYKQLTIGGR